MKRFLVALALLALAVPVRATPPNQAELTRHAERHASASWSMLRELLSLPNDAHFPDQIERNVEWMAAAFTSRGFAVSSLETAVAPLLLAERAGAGGDRTVLVYLQIDGQPVDPSRWDQADPWGPVLKQRSADGDWEPIDWERLNAGPVDPEWRIFARSASDAKGPVVMFLAALDALAEAGLETPYHLKVIMDFEEELGSPRLPAAVEAHRQALAADMLIIFDGPRHAVNRPTLYFGARGIATVTLTVFGPRVPQHSGHYGNYVPNPALRLAQLVGSMKNVDGRVTLPSFYDGVLLDDATREILSRIPDDREEILERLGVAESDNVASTYQEAIQYPSLNLRGLASGWVGSASRTIVPATATAEIDIRLVPEVDAERLVGLVREHVESAGYHLLDGREPTDEERRRFPRLASFAHEISYQAFRTPYESEVGLWLNAALKRGFGEEPVRIRMAGGSIPIAPFISSLGLPAVGVPAVQLDNNQHSPNENLRVGNFVEGVRTYLAILTQPFAAPPTAPPPRNVQSAVTGSTAEPKDLRRGARVVEWGGLENR